MKKLNRVDIILLVILALLTLIILFLGIKIYHQKKIHDHKYTDTIYLLTNESEKKLNIDLTKTKKKEFIVKVSNYSGTEVSKNKINYSIEITNKTDGKIEIYKNKNKNNKSTIPSKEKYILKDNKLEANNKTIDSYYIKIKDLPENSKNEEIEIIVKS